jgi:toxin CcdB
MAQFDLHRLNGGALVVDLQSDLIGLDATRLVAPLRPAGRHVALPGLTPLVRVEGAEWVVRAPELAAVRAALLGPAVGSLADRRDDLMRALDILTRGF